MISPQFDTSSSSGELRKGPITFYHVDQLHPNDSLIDQMQKFPGPLNDGNGVEESIL